MRGYAVYAIHRFHNSCFDLISQDQRAETSLTHLEPIAVYVNVQHHSRLVYSRVRAVQQHAFTLYNGAATLLQHTPTGLQQ
jgi:hypothetical protein